MKEIIESIKLHLDSFLVGEENEKLFLKYLTKSKKLAEINDDFVFLQSWRKNPFQLRRYELHNHFSLECNEDAIVLRSLKKEDDMQIVFERKVSALKICSKIIDDTPVKNIEGVMINIIANLVFDELSSLVAKKQVLKEDELTFAVETEKSFDLSQFKEM